MTRKLYNVMPWMAAAGLCLMTGTASAAAVAQEGSSTGAASAVEAAQRAKEALQQITAGAGRTVVIEHKNADEGTTAEIGGVHEAVTAAIDEATLAGGNEDQQIRVEVEVEADTEADGDDKDQPTVKRRVVIVGPDGKKKEINLDGKNAGVFKLDGEHSGVFRINTATAEGADGDEKKVERRIRVLRKKQDGKDGDKAGEAGVQGKVIIIGPDGEKKEIDLGGKHSAVWHSAGDKASGAKNFTRSYQIIRKNDGEKDADVEVQGKVVIVGPDGEKKEIDLGGKHSAVWHAIGNKVDGTKKAHSYQVIQKAESHKGGNVAVDGKVVIVGPDGKKKEIDLGDKAGNVVFGFGGKEGNKFIQRYQVKKDAHDHEVHEHKGGDDDGKKKTVHRESRVIVVGPDGKKKELKLDATADGIFMFKGDDNVKPHIIHGGEMKFDFDVIKEGGAIRLRQAGEDGKTVHYRIGVHAEPADESLRKHLQLGKHGLIIHQIVDDSAAAEAGIKVHDILTAVGNTHLVTTDDLVSAIQKAAGKPMRLSAVREGKKIRISVTPQKLDLSDGDGTRAAILKWMGDAGIDHPVEHRLENIVIDTIRPGLVIDDIKTLRKEMPNIEIDNLHVEGLDLEKLRNQIKVLVEDADVDVEDGGKRRVRIVRPQIHEHKVERLHPPKAGDKAAANRAELEKKLKELRSEVQRLQKELREFKNDN